MEDKEPRDALGNEEYDVLGQFELDAYGEENVEEENEFWDGFNVDD